jgi:hypothetical protein
MRSDPWRLRITEGVENHWSCGNLPTFGGVKLQSGDALVRADHREGTATGQIGGWTAKAVEGHRTTGRSAPYDGESIGFCIQSASRSAIASHR